MEILELDKAITREGFNNYYFTILNNKNKKYHCSLVVHNKQVVRFNCDCFHQMWEISRKVKTGKFCRHLTYCLNKLKEDKIL